MDSLPVEILEQICSLFCFHCQNPEAFPHADSVDVRLNKASLSRLARVSKSLYSLAQPFVYHYYATGNLPQTTIQNGARNTKTIYPSDDDKLPLFLRTIIRYPDLAAHVTALQLVESDNISGCTRDLVHLLEGTTESLGIILNPSRPRALAQCTNRYQCRATHGWLQELAILLLPNVKRLLISQNDPFEYSYIRDSGRELSSLKTLAIRPRKEAFHLVHASALYIAAPQLEILYAIDISDSDDYGHWDHRGRRVLPDLGLAGLQKLNLSNLPIDDLERVLRCCRSLSELHVSSLDWIEYITRGYWDMTDLIHALQPAKERLRTLTLTWVPKEEDCDPDKPIPHSYECAMLQAKQLTTVSTFRDFENLEVLAIDQAAFCLLDDRSIPSDRLIGFLPGSIKEVHFYFVYRDFLGALQTLVYKAPYQFPHLRVIHISLADRIELGRVKELEELRAINHIAQEVGIEVWWSTTRIGGCLIDDIPGVCPGSSLIPFFSSYKISAYGPIE